MRVLSHQPQQLQTNGRPTRLPIGGKKGHPRSIMDLLLVSLPDMPRTIIEDIIEHLIQALDVCDDDPDGEVEDDWECEADRPDFTAAASRGILSEHEKKPQVEISLREI